MRSLDDSVAIYKQQLALGDVQIAYTQLIRFMMDLDAHLSKELSSDYNFGNIFQGYMDYTYFYYTNDFLKSRKLKLGLVLNHTEMRFELWLLGQTKQVQKKYWHYLESTKWCMQHESMPKYAIFEAVIVDNPSFNDSAMLIKLISDELRVTTAHILKDLEGVKIA